MNTLNLSENLIKLRHEKKITQEELADFIGVTKASVSKWENRQSMPDIMLLPQLAAFFGVSVDEILGYQPQLSKEQIQKMYVGFCSDFASIPFDKAIEKVREAVKKYFSCYPFLLQVGILYLNHYMLAENPDEMAKLLGEASSLCSHIINSCKVVSISNDALALKTVLDLQAGKSDEVIEALEEITDPGRLSFQIDSMLIQAYMQSGEREKAFDFTQITIYLHLMSLIGSSVQYLEICKNDLKRCEETISRIGKLIEVYRINELNPNTAAQFFYQSAVVYATNRENGKALEKLDRYIRTVQCMMSNGNPVLHGDGYFDRLDNWIGNMNLGANPPRDRKFITGSAVQSLYNPAFAEISETEEFINIKNYLQEGIN